MPNQTRKNTQPKLQTAFVQAAIMPAPPAALGPVIPDDMVRRVTRITCNPAAHGTQVLVFAGSVANPVDLQKTTLNVATTAAGVTTVGGTHPGVPILVFRPMTSVAPTRLNQIYVVSVVAGETVIVEMEFYDVRG